MLLMLDNYDSFTFNLVQYLAELGADVRVVRNDQATVPQLLKMKPRSVVLSPGPGRPEHAGIMQELIAAIDPALPMLGVCLGHQAIAQVFGASIDYAPSLMHGKVSVINHNDSRLFAGVGQPFTATRYHSLIVDRSTLPSAFHVTAWTNDDLVMAIEHKERPLYGVQFHPESIMTPDGKTILKNFLEVAA